jgi:hypothetical protein
LVGLQEGAVFRAVNGLRQQQRFAVAERGEADGPFGIKMPKF